MSARSKWVFKTVAEADVFALDSSKTASMYPVEYGTEESDEHCGNQNCHVVLANGLSVTGIAPRFSDVPSASP